MPTFCRLKQLCTDYCVYLPAKNYLVLLLQIEVDMTDHNKFQCVVFQVKIARCLFPHPRIRYHGVRIHHPSRNERLI